MSLDDYLREMHPRFRAWFAQHRHREVIRDKWNQLGANTNDVGHGDYYRAWQLLVWCAAQYGYDMHI